MKKSGKKNVIAREVPLDWASFNNGDVFIIDVGDGLIQWNAPQSNRQEKMKGGQLARCIRDRERGGRMPIGFWGKEMKSYLNITLSINDILPFKISKTLLN